MLDPPPVGGRGIETKQGRTNGPNAADDPEKEDVMTNDSEPADTKRGYNDWLAEVSRFESWQVQTWAMFNDGWDDPVKARYLAHLCDTAIGYHSVKRPWLP